MANSFKFKSNSILANLGTSVEKLDKAVGMFASTEASRIEGDAKSQAKWTDRTGAARNRLKGSSEKINIGYRVQLSHGVDYGIWLELANEKRFAIVEPIIRLSAPYIMADFENLIGKLLSVE